MTHLENGQILARIAVLEIEVQSVKDLLGDQKDSIATLDGKLDQMLLREATGVGVKKTLSRFATVLIAAITAMVTLIVEKVLFRE